MNPKIKSLTGLRFFFVVLLFLHHLDMFYDLGIPGYETAMRYLGEGAVSVDFFFALSGFVIAYSYLPRLQNSEVTPGTFLFNRVAKLYPTHLLVWIVCVFIYSGRAYFLNNVMTKQFWAGVLLLQSYIPSAPAEWAFWGNGPAWSVSTELFFYIAFVFLVRLTNKERKALWCVLLAIILLNSIFLGNDTPIAGWLYYINPAFRLFGFLSGMLLCEWIQNLEWRPKNSLAATGIELLSLVVFAAFAFASTRKGYIFNPRLQSFYYLIPCLCIIFAFSYDKGVLSKICGVKIFQIFGNCSFAFYLIHQLVLYLTKLKFGSYIVDLRTMFIAAAVGIVVSLAVSLVLCYCFEKPVDRFARNVWKRRVKE